jgi:hypothetical protein
MSISNLGNNAGANSATAFADGEAQLSFHCNRDVVAGYHHFGAGWQGHYVGYMPGNTCEQNRVWLSENLDRPNTVPVKSSSRHMFVKNRHYILFM